MKNIIKIKMRKKGQGEATKLPWQSHIDYNRKAVIANERSECGNPIIDYNPKSHHEPASLRRGDRIFTTYQKPSLRTNEVSVAISLLTTTQKVITSLPLAGVVIAY